MIRAVAVLLVLAPLIARAQEGWTEAISGEVRAGEDFTAELPGGLVFRLEAEPVSTTGP